MRLHSELRSPKSTVVTVSNEALIGSARLGVVLWRMLMTRVYAAIPNVRVNTCSIFGRRFAAHNGVTSEDGEAATPGLGSMPAITSLGGDSPILRMFAYSSITGKGSYGPLNP